MEWYAVNTKPHQEHLAELNLARIGVETFFPQLKQNKLLRRKRQTIIYPLFPGYLFARFELEAHYRAVTYSHGVRKVVDFGQVPAIVDNEIIETIQSALQDGFVTLPQSAFTRGQVVRIKEGPLRGLEAIFECEMDDHERVVILLRALSYQARVIMDLEQLVSA